MFVAKESRVSTVLCFCGALLLLLLCTLCVRACAYLQVAYTHLPGNTAFRGFGVPQSAMICENVIEAVARHLGMTPEAVRQINMLTTTTTTSTTTTTTTTTTSNPPRPVRMATGQLLPHSHLPRIWGELAASAAFDDRRAEVDAFNATNRWRKRGLAIVPTCYGINFPLKYLNQARLSPSPPSSVFVVTVAAAAGGRPRACGTTCSYYHNDYYYYYYYYYCYHCYL